jgi:micrococcal nuclease
MAIFALGLGISCSAPPELPPGANAIVLRVIDGDTIEARFVVDGRTTDETVRLIGIDTPETKKPDWPVECFGPEASARTTELLPPRTPVLIRRDQESRDDYGRLLGYVFRVEDGLFVNETLLTEGLATTLAIPPNDRLAPHFDTIEATARRSARGMWGSCFAGPAGSVTP